MLIRFKSQATADLVMLGADAQGARRVFQLGVDVLERGPRGLDHQAIAAAEPLLLPPVTRSGAAALSGAPALMRAGRSGLARNAVPNATASSLPAAIAAFASSAL